MTRFVGIDLNGLCDRANTVADAFAAPAAASVGAVPATVVARAGAKERPLAGATAALAVDGRGWSWPDEARAERGEPPVRIPVLDLLGALGSKDEAVPTRFGPRPAPVLLGSHLAALAGRRARDAVVAIPDHAAFDEASQQRLIGAGRRAGLSPTLLWRPVAALYTWAQGMAPGELAVWDGRTALVASLLPDGMIVTRLGLILADTDRGPLLTPERRRAGAMDRSATGRLLAERAAERLSGGHPGLRWQALWGTDCAWQMLLGEDPKERLVQAADGHWALRRPSGEIAEDEAETLCAALARAAAALPDAGTGGELLLVEGPLAGARVGAFRLGAMAADRLRSSGGPAAERVEVLDQNAVAAGCALHAARLAAGLPTYWDFLPQLDINAVDKDGPCFVDLVPAGRRLVGGASYSGTAPCGFAISAGHMEIPIYLRKEGDERFRTTMVVLPEPPTSDVRVTLTVTQSPAQGYARVEIVPEARGVFGAGAVLLDWDALEPTDLSEGEILDLLRGGRAYPDPAPLPAHIALWEATELRDRIDGLLALAHPAPAEHHRAAARVVEALRRRSPPSHLNPQRYADDRPCAAVGSDGEAPDGWPRDVLQKLLERVGADFAAIMRSHPVDKPREALHRSLFLIMAWCHRAAPPTVRAYFLRVLRGERTRGWHRAVEAMGRVLSEPEELRVFFDAVTGAVAERRTPLYWLKASTQILQYRPEAPYAMTSGQALALAEAAGRALLEDIEQKGRAKLLRSQRFRWALYLILAALRYRIRDADFLTAGDASGQATLARLRDALDRASSAVGKGEAGLPATVAETIRFLDRRGTKGLILQETEALDAEEDGAGE